MKNYINDLFLEDKIANIFDKYFLDCKESFKNPCFFMEIFEEEFKKIKTKNVYTDLINKINKFYENFAFFYCDDGKKYENKFHELKYEKEVKKFIREVFLETNKISKEEENVEKDVEIYYKEMLERKLIIDIYYIFYERVEFLFLEYFIKLNKISLRKNITKFETDTDLIYDYDISELKYNEILPLKILNYSFYNEYFKQIKKFNIYQKYLCLIKILDELILSIRQETDLKKYEEKLRNFIKNIFLVLKKDLTLEEINEIENNILEKIKKVDSKNIYNFIKINKNYR